MTFSPLLQSVIDREELTVITDEMLDTFAADKLNLALLVSGDADRLAESDDLAVIFPELIRAARGTLAAAVVDRDSERLIQRRFRFNRFPCLVFLTHGQYQGVLQGVADWADYMRDVPDMMQREPTEPPRFEFPEGCLTQAEPAAERTH